MGRYDDITPEELRRQLLRFARLVRAMEKRDLLLEKVPSLLRLLGELRQMIFAYEVRSTRRLAASEAEEGAEGGAGRAEGGTGSAEGGTGRAETDPELEESLRIVREAIERDEELQKELGRGFLEEGDRDE